MELLVKAFADEDEERAVPEYYHENALHVQQLCLATEAIPFTILAAFDDNKYQGQMEISVKSIEKTFHTEKDKIRHPLKPVLWSANNFGKVSFCPPCAIAETSFEEGAGVTLVPGGATQKFRALLKVLDSAATTARADEATPAVRCSRKVCCALRGSADETTYKLNSVGSIEFATRLCSPRKNEMLHAIVSWRTKTDLVLQALCNTDEAEAADFKEFFSIEVKINKAIHDDSNQSRVQFSEESTPTKKHKEAMDAAGLLATPEPWAKRSRSE